MERESGRKQRQGNNGTDGAGTYEPRGGLSIALSEGGFMEGSRQRRDLIWLTCLQMPLVSVEGEARRTR